MKKNKVGGLSLPNSKICYEVSVIETVLNQHKDGCMDQWNRAESPVISSYIYSQLIFDKDAKTVQWRKDKLFNEECWDN